MKNNNQQLEIKLQNKNNKKSTIFKAPAIITQNTSKMMIKTIYIEKRTKSVKRIEKKKNILQGCFKVVAIIALNTMTRRS